MQEQGANDLVEMQETKRKLTESIQEVIDFWKLLTERKSEKTILPDVKHLFWRNTFVTELNSHVLFYT